VRQFALGLPRLPQKYDDSIHPLVTPPFALLLCTVYLPVSFIADALVPVPGFSFQYNYGRNRRSACAAFY